MPLVILAEYHRVVRASTDVMRQDGLGRVLLVALVIQRETEAMEELEQLRAAVLVVERRVVVMVAMVAMADRPVCACFYVDRV